MSVFVCVSNMCGPTLGAAEDWTAVEASRVTAFMLQLGRCSFGSVSKGVANRWTLFTLLKVYQGSVLTRFLCCLSSLEVPL